MAKSEWHFPRTAFAEQIYTLLVDSPAIAISLFGPRRTGKTEFLNQDLAPYAKGKKHRVVYVSLWGTIDAPLAGILHAFDASLRGGKLVDRIGTGLNAAKLKLKPPGTGAEVEIDMGQLRGKPSDNHLILLDQYCDRLSNQKRPTLLLFDEFQELARSDDTAPIIAALRTSLDKRKQGLVSVFTGSSQEGLRKVFSAKHAPFYRFATQMTLPQLDAAFVDHQLGIFKSKAKRKVSREDALRVFTKVEHNPLFFQQWLIALMAHDRLDADSAIAYVLEELGQQFGFADLWDDLGRLDRATLHLLAVRSDEIYGDDALTALGKKLGGAKPAKSKVQTAIRKLKRKGTAETSDDGWRMNDPLFEVWVRTRPDGDFLAR